MQHCLQLTACASLVNVSTVVHQGSSLTVSRAKSVYVFPVCPLQFVYCWKGFRWFNAHFNFFCLVQRIDIVRPCLYSSSLCTSLQRTGIEKVPSFEPLSASKIVIEHVPGVC